MAGAIGTEERSMSRTGAGTDVRSVAKQFSDLISEEVGLQLRNLYDQQKTFAIRKLHALSGVFHQAADQLIQERHESFARYANSAADRLELMNRRLSDKSYEEFAQDTKRFIRSKPVVVLGGGTVIGFLMALALKRAYQEPRIRRRFQQMPPLH